MKILSLQERVDFVNGVVAGCFVGDEYVPALFDVMFKLQVKAYFKGLDLSQIAQEDMTKVAYTDDKIDFLKYHPQFKEQTASLREACRNQLEYIQKNQMVNAVVNHRTSMDEFLDKLLAFLDEYKEKNKDVEFGTLLKALEQVKQLDPDLVAAAAYKAKGEEEV